MIVHVPTPLRSYTLDRATVEAEGPTLGALVQDLDQRFAGMRFRIIDEHGRVRPHIKLFVGHEATGDLNRTLADVTEVHIVCALSGG